MVKDWDEERLGLARSRPCRQDGRLTRQDVADGFFLMDVEACIRRPAQGIGQFGGQTVIGAELMEGHLPHGVPPVDGEKEPAVNLDVLQDFNDVIGLQALCIERISQQRLVTRQQLEAHRNGIEELVRHIRHCVCSIHLRRNHSL